ncbi:MAG: LysR family transcriptional regulator, partial [Pseudomonadota bacterium]|nr:LysR family transcriptional regulator [Pseudomonadota bacterium]
MDSLELIQTFREVARRGGFSAAARALDMSPANVSKYVAALEARFGVRLFHRTTRQVSLTDAGQLLYERSGPVLELVQMTASDLQQRATRPSGRLTVSAPHALMQTRLPALLGRFLSRHPAVSLSLRLSSRTLNLVEEGIDLALRVGPIPDENLIVRRLLRLHRCVVASPAYWDAHGRPAHPRELAEHRLLAVVRPGEAARWHFVDGGKPLELPVQAHVDANDVSALPELLLQGVGASYVAREAVAEHLASGALEPVLDAFIPDDLWVYAAYTQRRHNSAALAALLQFLQEELPAAQTAHASTPRRTRR